MREENVAWTHCCGGYGCSHCRPEEYLEQLEQEKTLHKNNKMKFIVENKIDFRIRKFVELKVEI